MQKHRHRDAQIYRLTGTQMHRHSCTDADSDMDKQTEIHRHTGNGKKTFTYINLDAMIDRHTDI